MPLNYARSCVIGLMMLPMHAHAVKDPDLLAGDIAQFLVPAAGLALTYYFDDSEGRTQWLKNTGTTLVATEILKYSLNNTHLGRRPNGGDRGFPSGHATASCSGAFFLANRYGWQYGGPALAVAAFTGYSRVDEGFHHWRDVIAGCALSYGISRYFVDAYPPKVRITPEIGTRYVGIQVSRDF